MIFSFESTYNKVEKALSKLDTKGKPESLYEPIRYLLDIGGKRLRPILAIYAHHIFCDNTENVLNPSLALEVFHNFTLMHDDIMDKAPIRRGFTTVHEKWNTNVAILSGDAMLVKAYQLLEGLPADIANVVLARFNATALQVCEGQMYDMDFERKTNVSVDSYIEMIKLKTSVLLGFSLELGAIVGRASKSDADKFFNLGVNAGIGFQIKDDLLDLYGASHKVGKQVGGDIIANKNTFLLVKFLDLANDTDTQLAFEWLTKTEFDSQQKVEFFKGMFEKYQLQSIAEELIKTYFDNAIAILDSLKVDRLRKGKLKALLVGLIEREK